MKGLAKVDGQALIEICILESSLIYYTETSGNKIALKVNAHTHMRFEAKKYIPDQVLPKIGITFIQRSNVYCIHSKWVLLGSLVSQPCAPGSMFLQISN